MSLADPVQLSPAAERVIELAVKCLGPEAETTLRFVYTYAHCEGALEMARATTTPTRRP